MYAKQVATTQQERNPERSVFGSVQHVSEPRRATFWERCDRERSNVLHVKRLSGNVTCSFEHVYPPNTDTLAQCTYFR